MKDKSAYLVLAPVGKSTTYSVAARRIGSKERYSIIGTTINEQFAERVVDGLNLVQGELVKLDSKLQLELDACRRSLKEQDQRLMKCRDELRDATNKCTRLQQDLDRVTNERNAAQQKAREEA